MRALIFAAGRGERMRPLSDHTPKPLLKAGGRMLIEYQIAALAQAGIDQIVINVAHLADAVCAALGDGAAYGVHIIYSREGDRAEHALETAGGIVKALPLLGPAPFLAVSGDVVTDFDYRRLFAHAQAIALGAADAHFVLVPNPPSHPGGDMGLAQGRVTTARPWFTYGNIGVFAPRLFTGQPPERRKLFPWMYHAVEAGRVTGELYHGRWYNVGSPAELAALDAELQRWPLVLQ
ncbi:MAG: nucleotidyltransferase family protein [Sutterellaceae bacterium]|nr:nucleotidyltransferase family protein [Burkholderiaceae bacterium]MCX7900755.1 nucleotidyltransferase family protein [Burkholderiaceae bacterium]MDW8429870.1 nucleotidyltransferase family protein [Sutterellaceae bacterium]